MRLPFVAIRSESKENIEMGRGPSLKTDLKAQGTPKCNLIDSPHNALIEILLSGDTRYKGCSVDFCVRLAGSCQQPRG
jgi:hypothetical protein